MAAINVENSQSNLVSLISHCTVNLNANLANQNNTSHLGKLVQYKSIPYPHCTQPTRTYRAKKYVKPNYLIKSMRTNSGDISTNYNSATNRCGIVITQQVETDGTSRINKSQQKNNNQNSHYKDESFYEIPQIQHKKRIISSQKSYLYTNNSDSENASIQEQDYHISTDQLRTSNYNNGSCNLIRGSKPPLSFKESLQNSYVSVDNRDDIALAKKIELIMCSRNQSRRSIKEQNQIQNMSQNRIIIINSKNPLNSSTNNIDAEQLKINEQSQLGQSIRLKSAQQPFSFQQFGKQNSYMSDTGINQNSSKQEIFNYLKRKIYQKEQEDKINNAKSYRFSNYFHKQENSEDRIATDFINTSLTTQNYTPPPQIQDLINNEKRTRYTQSSGKRVYKKQTFYEKFSQKLKDSLILTENLQNQYMYQTDGIGQNNINQWQNQPIIHDKGQQRYLSTNFNPINRNKRILSSIDNQLNSTQCEKVVANYVNKSIFGDVNANTSLWKYPDDRRERSYTQTQMIPNTSTIEEDSVLKPKMEILKQESSSDIKNSFYQNSKVKSDSQKLLQPITISRNSTKQMLKENSSGTIKQFNKIEEKVEDDTPQINKNQPYNYYQNKSSNDQDDLDLREYLSGNKGFPINPEIIGSDYS